MSQYKKMKRTAFSVTISTTKDSDTSTFNNNVPHVINRYNNMPKIIKLLYISRNTSFNLTENNPNAAFN